MTTPSEEIVAAANATATVNDKRGRQIIIKKLNALDRMRIAELVGPENVKNDVYFGYALFAYYVVSIDGLPRPRGTKLQIESTVQLLDEDGLLAVAGGVKEHFTADEQQVDEGSLKN